MARNYMFILLIGVVIGASVQAIQMREGVVVSEEPAVVSGSGASGAADPNEDEFPMDFKGKKSPAQVMIDTLGKVVLDMRNDQKKMKHNTRFLWKGAKKS